MKLRSGTDIPCITPKDAENRCFLTRTELTKMHLMPTSEPVAYGKTASGAVIYYFSSEKVIETPPELWYFPSLRRETLILESGAEIERMTAKRAASFGFFTKEKLENMHYRPVEEPVAYARKTDRSIVYFFDKRTAVRTPLMCVKCEKNVRYKRKLCRECYEADMAERRAEGEAYRASYFGMKRERVLFFDLELTGFYDRDEIISITVCDGNGTLIMNTFVKPTHTKRWKRTEKIHGITPEMTENCPTLAELTPRIKEIFADADAIIAYGVSTDFSHIKYIYETEAERDWLHKKIRCAANEFVRYIHEMRPDILHASLSDAMECFGIAWDGIAHSSIADTIACRAVWEKLFPNYYNTPADGKISVMCEPGADRQDNSPDTDADNASDNDTDVDTDKETDGESVREPRTEADKNQNRNSKEKQTEYDVIDDIYALAADMEAENSDNAEDDGVDDEPGDAYYDGN